jgi:hypothetical protein
LYTCPQTQAEVVSPRGDASAIYRHSQLLCGGALRHSSLSTAALENLARPEVEAVEPVRQEAQPAGLAQRLSAVVARAFAFVQRWTGFNRAQVSLGIQVR